MQSLFFLIVTLAILVVIHEYGHFWVARRCGVKVLKFSVGFGKPLWSKRGQDGTEYIIAAIPLGGYVKMLDEREGDVAEHELEYAFNNQSLSARTAIVAAGPVANLIFAVIAYWFVFLVGVPGTRSLIDDVSPNSPADLAQIVAGDEIKTINGNNTPTWSSVYRELSWISEKGGIAEIVILSGNIEIQRQLEIDKQASSSGILLKKLGLQPVRAELPPIIAELIHGGAAEQAGLMEGDKIISVDGEEISTWSGFVAIVQVNANQVLNVTIQRESGFENLSLTPSLGDAGIGKIGVKVDVSQYSLPEHLRATEHYGWFSALIKAHSEVWLFSVSTLKGIGGMLTGNVSSKNIGGPITIAQYASASADHGLISFVSFLAMISISLGLLNLLPIPVLDGGHLMLYFIEWARGKPLSDNAQMQFQKVGLFLLLMLMFLAFSNDLTRLFG